MSESRRSANVAMEQILGNMNSALHNSEGQYLQLGLTPPPSPSDHVSWNSQNQSYMHHHSPELSNAYLINQQQQQLPHYNSQTMPFNFVQQPSRYVQDQYEKCVYQSPTIQNNTSLYHQFFIPQPEIQENNFVHARNYHDNIGVNSTSHNPTHLIENVVGNWVPNTTGTYSPFGNTNNTKPGIANIFEMQPEAHSFNHIVDDAKLKDNEEFCNFHFNNNRDTRKPRIVAEVKPMRPSYSDVLTKPVSSVIGCKINKVDFNKDLKQKQDGKKVLKNDKTQKVNLQRLNSDIRIEKNTNATKFNDKSLKTDQLNRRWASLDNMHASSTDLNGKKTDESAVKNRTSLPKTGKKSTEIDCDDQVEDVDNNSENILNISKTMRKVGTKNNSKPKGDDKTPTTKRAQRSRKRDKEVTFGIVGQKIKQYVPGWWKFFVSLCLWLIHLIADICSLSVHLSRDVVNNFWNVLSTHWKALIVTGSAILRHMTFLTWFWDKLKKKKESAESRRISSHYSELENNIAMPSTGDEAMKRLLACKGKDPYSILGVMPTCSDDDVKRYYKRQAFLVHPDKNQQPGAEEAFKILVHAFDMIGEPERRARYDRGVAESAQVEQAWSKFSDLLAQLQKKVEAAANTIRCSACSLRHKRIKIDRPSYAARNCATCKIHHSAREGDIWAEAKCLGFLWHYYACMDGGIYDITEWAGCQKESLQHLKPNSHNVQYRIALGKQNGQQARAAPRSERSPNLESLLNTLYGNKDAPQNIKRRNKKSK